MGYFILLNQAPSMHKMGINLCSIGLDYSFWQ